MNHSANWIPQEIARLCRAYPRRTAGSRAEYDCQKDLAAQLEPWSDKVTIEPYSLHPQAFMASVGLEAVCDILSVACFLLFLYGGSRAAGLIGLLLLCLSCLSWVFEFMGYRQLMDCCYPKRISHNVFAVRHAQGAPKRRIIFTGHADAAYEMPLMHAVPLGLFVLLWVAADAGMFCCMAFDVLALLGAVQQQTLHVFAMIQCLLLIPFGFFLFFVNWRVVADGANDNLTGCLASMDLLKKLAENDERFADTEVCCLLTGGEESGLRGAFAFAKAHRAALSDIDTLVISVDTLRETSQLMVYPRGINGTQKNSPRVCALLKAAGEECGITLGEAGFYPGGTDADAFSRCGYQATALCGIRQTPTDYYHTRLDTADNLDPHCIAAAGEILEKALRRFAQGRG